MEVKPTFSRRERRGFKEESQRTKEEDWRRRLLPEGEGRAKRVRRKERLGIPRREFQPSCVKREDDSRPTRKRPGFSLFLSLCRRQFADNSELVAASLFAIPFAFPSRLSASFVMSSGCLPQRVRRFVCRVETSYRLFAERFRIGEKYKFTEYNETSNEKINVCSETRDEQDILILLFVKAKKY